MMPGPGSRAQLSDKDLVESVLRELSEAADKWEALVGQAETITYSVDLGDIQCGRSIRTAEAGRIDSASIVMSGYTHGELADRLNLAIAALREEAEAREPGALRRSSAVTGIRCRARRSSCWLADTTFMAATHFDAGLRGRARATSAARGTADQGRHGDGMGAAGPTSLRMTLDYVAPLPRTAD